SPIPFSSVLPLRSVFPMSREERLREGERRGSMKAARRVILLGLVLALGITTAIYACPPVSTEFWYYDNPDLLGDPIGLRIHTCCPGSTWYTDGQISPYYEVFYFPCYENPF